MKETLSQQVYGLVGHPLGHSFSASYFNEKFEREGLDAVYMNFDLSDISQLPDLFATYPNLRGLNVTIPYKEAVIPLLDSLQEDARHIGAVNVIRPEHTPEGLRLRGFNTDFMGFRRSLEPYIKNHKAALVLGTGGASLAVRYALGSCHIQTLSVSRSAGKDRITYQDITDEILRTHTLIVNTTPLGMYPNVDTCPDIPYEKLTHRHLLYDLVYNPDETRFMQLGKAQGASAMNGLQMLHNQADAAWEIWQGNTPSI